MTDVWESDQGPALLTEAVVKKNDNENENYNENENDDDEDDDRDLPTIEELLFTKLQKQGFVAEIGARTRRASELRRQLLRTRLD